MKGVILAGGTGSRLFPVTFTHAKQLLPVANEPVIKHVVDDLVDAGIEEIGVVLGKKGRAEIQSYLGDGSQFGADLTYIVQGEPLGLAHAVGCARDFVGEDSFVVYLGDIVLENGVGPLVEGFDPDKEAIRMGVQTVENPSRYGVVNTDANSNVLGLEEKPEDPKTDLVSVGVSTYSPKIFDAIEDVDPSWRGELELSDANHTLIESGAEVTAEELSGWWIDTGTPTDLLAANRAMLTANPDGATMTTASGRGEVAADIGPRVIIEPPVSIAEGAKIEGECRIGPHASIAQDVTIRGTSVEDSVVLSGATLEADTRVTESIIGEDASVTDRESGTSFVIADETEVNL